MNLSRNVSEIIREHVTLEVESIDRMYLNVYQPQLQRELGVVGFLLSIPDPKHLAAIYLVTRAIPQHEATGRVNRLGVWAIRKSRISHWRSQARRTETAPDTTRFASFLTVPA